MSQKSGDRCPATNAELLRRRQAAVPRGIAHACPVFPARARGAEVHDVEGRRYIDFASGIAALNVGHLHPRVKAAALEQIDRYTHPAFQVMPYEPYVALAERLNALAPGTRPRKTIFFTTGSEAIENAVKIARAASGRPALVSFTGGFHGRTLLALALTGKVVPYKRGFGPFPGEVYHAPYPMEYRGIGAAESMRALELLFDGEVEPSRVAAVVIEPVLGEGGFYPAPAEFLRRLRGLCGEHGILLIADEIQTGCARTGRFFAIEHAGVVPELITVAKSLAGGFPLAGIIGDAEVMDSVEPGALGGTFGGNPIACAAALATLDVIEEEKLAERAREQGERILARLRGLAVRRELAAIGDVRGLGAMCALELVRDRTTREPAPELARAVVARALARGLLVLPCGFHANVVRILAPLNTPEALLDEGLDILEAALEDALRGP
jgi:4-aminobutyrate aminotransferase